MENKTKAHMKNVRILRGLFFVLAVIATLFAYAGNKAESVMAAPAPITIDGCNYYPGYGNPTTWKGIGKRLSGVTTNPSEYGYGIYPNRHSVVSWNYNKMFFNDGSNNLLYYMYPDDSKSGTSQ